MKHAKLSLKYLIFLGVFVFVFFTSVSFAEAATLYFNGGANHNWNTRIGNWWTDSGFTLQAPSLPTSSDDVILSSYVSSNSGSTPSVNTLTLNGTSSVYINIPITVVNGATFNGGTRNSTNGIITGDAVFNSTSNSIGNVIGDVIFNDTTTLYGDITGNVTFNDTSTLYGDITGNATFHTDWYSAGVSAPSGGVFPVSSGRYWAGSVSGVVYGTDLQAITMYEFNGTSYNIGVVGVDATFNTTHYDASPPSGGVFTISGTANWDGSVSGTVYGTDDQVITSYVFNDDSYIGDSYDNTIINGNVVFNGSSYNKGTINGNATFNTTHYDASPPSGGVFNVGGTSFLDGSVSGTVYGTDDQAITSYVFNDDSYNAGSLTSVVTFYDSSYNGGTITGNPVFYDSSSNVSTVAGNAIFNGNSHNDATITGDVTLNTTYYDASAPIGGVLTISGSSYFAGTVGGVIYGTDDQAITSYVFNDDSYNGSSDIVNVTFNDSSRNDEVIEEAIFNDSSYNNGTVTNATFNDSSYNNGTIEEDATFVGDLSENNNTVNGTKIRKYTDDITTTRDFISTGPWTVVADGADVNIIQAQYDGTTTFQTLNSGSFIEADIFWYNSGIDNEWTTLTGNWWDDEAHTIQSASLPDGTNGVKTLGSVAPNINVDSFVAPYRIDASLTGLTATSATGAGFEVVSLIGDAIFNDSVYFGGTLTGDANFYDTSINYGTVTGDACFDAGATNSGTVNGAVTIPCPNVYTLTYSAGANGSITGDTSQIINEGGSGTAITAVPDSGYEFTNWSDLSIQNPRTDLNISGDIAVTANFSSAENDSEEEEETPNVISSGSSAQSIQSNLASNSLTPSPNTPTPKDCISSYKFSPSTGLPCTKPKFIFNTNLYLNLIHPDVLQLQKYLNAHSFLVATTGAGSPGNETSKFGALTKAALIKFQIANKINPAVGFFGPITRGIVNSPN